MRAALPFLFLMLAGSVFAADVPHVTDAMRTSSFWTARHPSADKRVMTPAEIAAFNTRLQKQGLTDDLAAIPSAFPAKKLKALIMAQAQGVLGQELFRADGTKVDGALRSALTQALGLEALHDDALPRYAFTAGFTNERLLPTQEPLYATPGGVDFDEVQNSGLDPATPVVVLWQSADGRWFFVKDGISAGWVRGEDIGFTDEKVWRMMVAGGGYVTVIAPRTDIYLEEMMDQVIDTARMGARLFFRRIDRGAVEIIYPRRRDDGTAQFISAFVLSGDVVRGALPYDARTVIGQAFALLDAPYGWGDMHGRQDCSRFIQMIFASVGLQLPRNSAEQGLSGLKLADLDPAVKGKDRVDTIAGQGIGGLTLLRLKGHIMLYLGQADGRLYVIHAMWAYRHKEAGVEVAEVLGRVVVSDLSLGEGSSKGSFLDRVLAVRFLGTK